MYRFTVCLVLFVCSSAFVQANGYGGGSLYGSGPIYGGVPRQIVVGLPQRGQASAAALTDIAGAKAAASKINAANWRALDRYGYQIGAPLLTKNYGPLTKLYAASLPPRSFVGKIDPAFVKDYYGGVKFIGETEIGVAAL